MIIVIPARFASTRFPGKPLAMLAGKPVIQHVYEKALSVLPEVYVATDDQRIFSTVQAFGGKAVMTRPDHQSGTDRIEEAVSKIGGDIDVVVNIQGDEPFIRPEQIRTVMSLFDDPATQIGTLAVPFASAEQATNVNSPKVVCDKRNFALYFSRSVIPFVRNAQHAPTYLKHIGVYAYRRSVLHEVTQLPPSPAELAESLEQLRWLENGYRIRVGLTQVETIGIDTPQDLAAAERFIQQTAHKA